MAATDNFRNFNAGLSATARQAVESLIRQTNEDLFAARSEDARNRIVEEHIRQVRETLEMLSVSS